MWYNNMDTSFFRFVTIHAFDGQTDRQLSRGCMQRGKMERMHPKTMRTGLDTNKKTTKKTFK